MGLAVLLSGWLFYGLVAPVSAATDPPLSAITIEPYLQEVVLQPGEAAKSFKLEVTNNTSANFDFKLQAVDFGSLDETGGVLFTGGRGNELASKYGLANWLVLDLGSRSLAPGQKTAIEVTIDNRSDLAPGGHYAAIVLASQAGQGQPGQALVNLQKNLSALVFAKKVGGEIYDLKLDRVDFSKNLLVLPSKVNLRFQNTGNVHVVPRGLVVITDPFNRVVRRGVINPESGIILPGSFRVYPTQLSATGGLNLPGPYKLSINYRFDGQDEFQAATLRFSYVGWPLGLILLGVLVFLARRYKLLGRLRR